MLATVERNMQAITSNPATRGTRTTASALGRRHAEPAGGGDQQRGTPLRPEPGCQQGPRERARRGAGHDQAAAHPDRPLSEKTDRAVKLIAPKPKFIPRPKTSSTVRR